MALLEIVSDSVVGVAGLNPVKTIGYIESWAITISNSPRQRISLFRCLTGNGLLYGNTFIFRCVRNGYDQIL